MGFIVQEDKFASVPWLLSLPSVSQLNAPQDAKAPGPRPQPPGLIFFPFGELLLAN